jgi:hypothetical protein
LCELTLVATGVEQAMVVAAAEEWQAMIAAVDARGVIEGDGARGARFVAAVEPSTNVASLTVEQLEALLLGKLFQQQQLDQIDSWERKPLPLTRKTMSLLSSFLLNHLPLQEQTIELLHQTLRTLKVAFLIALLIAMIALLIVIWTYVPSSGKPTDGGEL